MLAFILLGHVIGVVIRRSPPDSLDWRKLGVILPVHDQGQMNDPVALAVSDAMYAFGNITTKLQTLPSLQEIVDCCSSRWATNYFDCIVKLGGVCSIDGYPKPGGGSCQGEMCQVEIALNYAGSVPKGNETNLLEALLEAPVVVYINVNMGMETYTGGVFDDPSCSPEGLNHGMLLVGYTSEYWILKNSWGIEWGENGYVYLIRGKNMCGVAEFATYPSLH